MTGCITDEICEYRAGVRLGLRQWDLFLNLGLAYLVQNDCPKAIGALRTAVFLGADQPDAHFNVAIAYERGRQLREALQEIRAALRLAPSDPDEHDTKAIICSELGDLAGARDEWEHLVQVARYLHARPDQPGDCAPIFHRRLCPRAQSTANIGRWACQATGRILVRVGRASSHITITRFRFQVRWLSATKWHSAGARRGCAWAKLPAY